MRKFLLTGILLSSVAFHALQAHAQSLPDYPDMMEEDTMAEDGNSAGQDIGLPTDDAPLEGDSLDSQLSDAEASAEEGNDGDLLPPGPDALLGEGVEVSDPEGSMKQDMHKDAFQSALDSLLPLSPDEIRTLREKMDRTQESVYSPIYPPPKAEMSVQTISLDPGSPPITVRLAFGYVTTLNIVDVTGAPWPIEDVSWVGDIEVQDESEQEANHIIRVSPAEKFQHGNMSLRLVGLQTPVIVSLERLRDVVDYRFDAIVPQYGPLAQAPLIESSTGVQAGDPGISSVLEGIMPEGAEKLNVTGVDSRTSAYRHEGVTYVRTPLTLLSPAWTASASSADGMHVYALEDAPVLLLSDKGKMVRAKLSDREDILE